MFIFSRAVVGRTTVISYLGSIRHVLAAVLWPCFHHNSGDQTRVPLPSTRGWMVGAVTLTWKL